VREYEIKDADTAAPPEFKIDDEVFVCKGEGDVSS